MSDVATRLREMAALSDHPADAYALCGEAAEEIENLRVLYALACDACRREAERAERAEALLTDYIEKFDDESLGDDASTGSLTASPWRTRRRIGARRNSQRSVS